MAQMDSDFEEETSMIERHSPVNIEVDTTAHFMTDKIFSDKEEVIEWARKTGREHGVVVIVCRSDLDAQKRRPRILLGCERSGGYRGKGSGLKRRTGTRKCNCPFTLKGQMLDLKKGTWNLVVSNGVHNHQLVTEFEGHSYVGRLSKEEKETVERLAKAGVRTRDILNNLKLKDPTNASTLKTVYNARTSLKIREKAGRTHMQQLFSLLTENGYVCRNRNEPNTDRVLDLFWSSGTSIKLCTAFPIVFMLDCTYKTNKYRLPLLQIVGLTSTEKTFSAAFSFMHAEKEENYVWALTCFKDLFDGALVPDVMISDREIALLNAIKTVFPGAKNLLCRVHIERNVLSNCLREFPQRATFEEFMKCWATLMNSSSNVQYNENLVTLESTFGEFPAALAYVKDSWLLKYKEYFISNWIDLHLHMGNTSTNRVEGSHAKLKKYLSNSVGGFVECFNKINILLAGQLTEIKASLEDSFTRVPLRFRNPLFKQLVGFVLTAALEKIENELNSIPSIGVEASQCNHRALYSLGLPCAHMLSTYRAENRSIPLSDVHRFWKKLTITPLDADINEEMSIEAEMNMIYNMYAVGTIAQKMELKRKLQELGNSSHTTALEPEPKVNVRGRKKAKKGARKAEPVESTTRDPSHFEHVLASHVFEGDGNKSQDIVNVTTEAPIDQSQDPVMQSQLNLDQSQVNEDQSAVPVQVKSSTMKKTTKRPSPGKCKSKLPVRRTRNANTSNWIQLFPVYIQQYITKVIDVPGDGHCGFRVVASFFDWPSNDGWRRARTDLANELQHNKDFYDNILHPLSSTAELLKSVDCFEDNPDKEKWMTMPFMGHVISTCYNCMVLLLSEEMCISFYPMREPPPVQDVDKLMVFGFINGSHFVRLEVAPHVPIPPTSKVWSKFHLPAASQWPASFTTRIEHFKSVAYVAGTDTTTSDVIIC